jgi:U3 small nucleolar RNA-associated protein 14
MVDDFKPETDMEVEIHTILAGAGLVKTPEVVDDLPLNKLTEEEVRARRAEILKMKNLLYYRDLKVARSNRIKSKKYRKLMKKQKEKNKPTLEELAEIDPELAKKEAEKLARQRIEERISLKHSKGKSKFSRNANMQQDGTRSAVEEQLKIRDRLRKKMDRIQ